MPPGARLGGLGRIQKTGLQRIAAVAVSVKPIKATARNMRIGFINEDLIVL